MMAERLDERYDGKMVDRWDNVRDGWKDNSTVDSMAVRKVVQTVCWKVREKVLELAGLRDVTMAV